MKAAAAALLVGAFLCIGSLLRDGLRRRAQVMGQICLFLRQVRLRANLHQPLGAAVAELAQDPELALLTFLPDCAARCRAGVPLPQAWTLAVETFRHTGKISPPQGQTLANLLPALCAADGQRLDSLLNLYESRAQTALAQAEETAASTGGLCVRVSGAVGLLLGILIL